MEMREDTEKLKQIESEFDLKMDAVSQGLLTSSSWSSNNGKPWLASIEQKLKVDERSIYVGNVDYGATSEQLENHFHGCGTINRVTILSNKYNGHPKGCAYIEFADKESVSTAMTLDESLFRGRQIKVSFF